MPVKRCRPGVVIAIALATSFPVPTASEAAKPPATGRTLPLYEEIKSIQRPISVDHIGLVGDGGSTSTALVDILESYVLSTLTPAERDSLDGPWRRGHPALPFKMHSEKWKATVLATVIRQLKDERERRERLGLPVYE